MAVAHKRSISMGLILIPIGMAAVEKKRAAKILSKDMCMRKTGMWS